MSQHRRHVAMAAATLVSAVLMTGYGDAGGAPQTASPDDRAHRAAREGRGQEAVDLVWSALQALPLPAPDGLDLHLRRDILSFGNTSWPVPEDAVRMAYRAEIAVREARDESGVWDAERELQRAVRMAPWSGPATFNLAIAQSRIGLFSAAAGNMALYLDFLAAGESPQSKHDLKGKIWDWEYARDQGKG